MNWLYSGGIASEISAVVMEPSGIPLALKPSSRNVRTASMVLALGATPISKMSAVDTDDRPIVVLASWSEHRKRGLEQSVAFQPPALGIGVGFEAEHAAAQECRIAEPRARGFDVLDHVRLAAAREKFARRRNQIRVAVLAGRVTQRRIRLTRRTRPNEIEAREEG
jgi:hypothetical protein